MLSLAIQKQLHRSLYQHSENVENNESLWIREVKCVRDTLLVFHLSN